MFDKRLDIILEQFDMNLEINYLEYEILNRIYDLISKIEVCFVGREEVYEHIKQLMKTKDIDLSIEFIPVNESDENNLEEALSKASKKMLNIKPISLEIE